MTSAIVVVVLVFVLHFERTNFFKMLLRVATFILVFRMCCLSIELKEEDWLDDQERHD